MDSVIFLCLLRENDGAKKAPQYVLLYPSASNYYVLRQDDQQTTWWTSIQQFFQSIGGGSGSGEEAGAEESSPDAASAPAASATKSGFDMKKPTPMEPFFPNLVLEDKKKDEKNDKFFYLTPASTSFLNPDKRLFVLPQQQKFIGTISGPILNPVFNVQPIPTLVARSNIANPADESQPLIKVVSENAQKFSQIPPVMANIEPLAQPVLQRSHITEAIKAANPEPENRIAPVEAVQTRAGVEVDEEGKVGYSIEQDGGVVQVNSVLPLKVQPVADLKGDIPAPVVGPVVRSDVPAPVVAPVVGNNVPSAVVIPIVRSEILSPLVSSLARDGPEPVLAPVVRSEIASSVVNPVVQSDVPVVRSDLVAAVAEPIVEPKVKEVVSVSQGDAVVGKVDDVSSKVV